MNCAKGKGKDKKFCARANLENIIYASWRVTRYSPILEILRQAGIKKRKKRETWV